jgi:2-polyprenyl-6-methoxyphenol hydroxylase-like FAD-dependent oxidoreductase
MHALIVGGGVCGPVTALALRRAGIDAVVYDARPGPIDEGSYLTVATNGLDALRAIDAHAAVIDAGFPTPWTVLWSGTGKRLGRVPIGSTRSGREASHTIRRAHLQRALHDEAARRGVRIAYRKTLVGAETAGARVRARFADGSDAVGDLLIGCDGVHSATRRVIDAAAPPPRYVGLLNFGGYTPGRAVGEAGAWHMIFGARAFFGYVPDRAGGTVWFANVPRHASTRAERDATSAGDWTRWLIGRFAADRGPAAELIAAGRLELAADNTHDLPSVPTWHRGPLIVIGDAAHAPSPSSGQGASMAIEDGVVLAQCLRDVSGVSNAFAVFEQVRRRRVERIVKQGARSSSRKAAGPIGRIVRDRILPLMFRYLVTAQSVAWMYEHHIDWDRRVGRDDRRPEIPASRRLA